MGILDQLESEMLASIELGDYVSVDEAEFAFNTILGSDQLLNDDDAFRIIEQSMNFMYQTGEISRLQQMAMTLGAAACMHEHLQEMSSKLSETFADKLLSKKDHAHDHDDDEDHEHEDEDDEYEWVIVNGKLVRRKKKKHV